MLDVRCQLRAMTSIQHLASDIYFCVFCDRKLDDHPRASRSIRLCADAPSVLGHDALDDGEAEARTAPACGEIRLEEAGEVRAGDAVAGVCDFGDEQAARGVVSRGDGDPALAPGLGHGLDGVVYEVDEDAPDLLGVEHRAGQVAS